MARRKALIAAISVALILSLSPSAFSAQYGSGGPEGDIEDWVIIESNFATIYVDKDIDLKRLLRQIDVGFARYDPIERELFLDKGFSDEEKLANKIDIIVRKDKKTLDMYPHAYHVNIRIYEKNSELWDIYREIFKERKEYKGFHIHKFRTIYLSLPEISESVLEE